MAYGICPIVPAGKNGSPPEMKLGPGIYGTIPAIYDIELEGLLRQYIIEQKPKKKKTERTLRHEFNTVLREAACSCLP